MKPSHLLPLFVSLVYTSPTILGDIQKVCFSSSAQDCIVFHTAGGYQDGYSRVYLPLESKLSIPDFHTTPPQTGYHNIKIEHWSPHIDNILRKRQVAIEYHLEKRDPGAPSPEEVNSAGWTCAEGLGMCVGGAGLSAFSSGRGRLTGMGLTALTCTTAMRLCNEWADKAQQVTDEARRAGKVPVPVPPPQPPKPEQPKNGGGGGSGQGGGERGGASNGNGRGEGGMTSGGGFGGGGGVIWAGNERGGGGGGQKNDQPMLESNGGTMIA